MGLRPLLVFLLSVGFSSYAFESPEAFHKESSDLKALVFLSSTCPCSDSHVEHLNRLTAEYPNLKIL